MIATMIISRTLRLVEFTASTHNPERTVVKSLIIGLLTDATDLQRRDTRGLSATTTRDADSFFSTTDGFFKHRQFHT